MLDSLASYNRARWNELVDAGILFSRPMLQLDAASARHLLDPNGNMGNIAGRRVLCLAAGGGQQSVAFALLGAEATVFDLSDAQLEQDLVAAAHYGLTIATEQGDMRDLSRFPDAHFDLVYHAYSLPFVPNIQPVIREVARVLRPAGLYRVEWANPFVATLSEDDWTGEGYLLRHRYIQGRDLSLLAPHWDVENVDGNISQVSSPKEFVHTLSTVVNTLSSHGFVIRHLSEATGEDTESNPGSWNHFMQVAAPWLTIWCIYMPELTQSPIP
jgi:ubiquinone/menaquinone biosynthesis C-methylase UbiE